MIYIYLLHEKHPGQIYSAFIMLLSSIYSKTDVGTVSVSPQRPNLGEQNNFTGGLACLQSFLLWEHDESWRHNPDKLCKLCHNLDIDD